MDKEQIKIKIWKLNKRISNYRFLIIEMVKKRDKLVWQLSMEDYPDLFKVQK